MKKIFLAMILMAASVCFAQQPIYNKSAGTLTLTIAVDTTQQMYGCSTNNYNAEGQCTGSMGWYYHTGNVSVSLTNVRTGQTSGGSQTITGGIATATGVVNVRPGDVVNVTTTNRVFCPVVNIWSGFLNQIVSWEIAYTREKVTYTYPNAPAGHNTYIVAPYCSYPTAGHLPDYRAGNIVWSLETVSAFDLYALCYSSNGHQPWSCLNISADEWTIDPGPVPACTYTP